MAEPAWLEVSLLVNGELAEAVAETLSRFIDGGIVFENTELDHRNGTVKDELRVFGYVPVDQHLEQTRKKIAEALWHLGQIEPLPQPTYTFIEEMNWMEAWKEHYRPIEVGRRFLVLPAWIEMPKDSQRLAIRIEPGMAFGTGTHPSTQLSLEMLERWVQPGGRVIDMGCGSGILSIGAVKLETKNVLAVDIDVQAIDLAKENLVINHMEDLVEIGVASVQEILNGSFSILQAEIVVANMLSGTILRLISVGLEKLVSSDGTLILSGLLEENEEEIVRALQMEGFTIIADRLTKDDWVALAARRG